MKELHLEHIILRTLIEDGMSVSEARRLLIQKEAPKLIVSQEWGYTVSLSPSKEELYEDTLAKLALLYTNPTIKKLVEEALRGERTLLDSLVDEPIDRELEEAADEEEA